jgi:hypothetical protein
VTAPQAAVDGLRRHARRRSQQTQRKIAKAIGDLNKKGAPINVNAVARHADVTRNTIYNHPDLLERIRAHNTSPKHGPLASAASTEPNTLVAALRRELLTQQRRYQTQIDELRTALKQRDQALAAAHGEIQRLSRHQ